MNHNSLDLSFLNDSSSDTQTSGDFDASANCTLLLENDKKYVHDGVLQRLTQFTKKSGSSFVKKFCRDNDSLRNKRLHSLSRQLQRNATIKRYIFLFGFVSTLIIFSQLCLLLYNYDPDVEGLYAMTLSLHLCLRFYFPFSQLINDTNTFVTTHIKWMSLQCSTTEAKTEE